MVLTKCEHGFTNTDMYAAVLPFTGSRTTGHLYTAVLTYTPAWSTEDPRLARTNIFKKPDEPSC